MPTCEHCGAVLSAKTVHACPQEYAAMKTYVEEDIKSMLTFYAAPPTPMSFHLQSAFPSDHGCCQKYATFGKHTYACKNYVVTRRTRVFDQLRNNGLGLGEALDALKRVREALGKPAHDDPYWGEKHTNAEWDVLEADDAL